MRRRFLTTLILATLATGMAFARQSPPDWAAVTAALERAVLGDDVDGVRKARADLLRLLASGPAPDRAPLVNYAVAYAGWRLSTNPSVSSRERDDLLDDAEARLKTAIKLDENFAEGHALLSGVYGLKIAHSPMSGMFLGSRSSGAGDRAMALAPENPRVLIARGVGKFNTPSMFGGDTKEAERCLRLAIEKLAAEPADKPFPAWGRFDAHAWLGQALAKRADLAGARAEYAKALEVAPQSGWVRYVLLPALDKR